MFSSSMLTGKLFTFMTHCGSLCRHHGPKWNTKNRSQISCSPWTERGTIVWHSRSLNYRPIDKKAVIFASRVKERNDRLSLSSAPARALRASGCSVSFQRSRSGGGALCRRPPEFRNRDSFPSASGVKLITLSGGSTSLTLRAHRMAPQG